jgi:hypothetical protein
MSDADRLFQLVEPAGPLKNLWSIPQPIHFDDYALAYWDAAKELAGEGTFGSLSSFPTVFLYRHAIEVYLKAILITFGGGVLERREVEHHRLADLLPHLERVCNRARLKLSPQLTSTVSEWQSYDPDGMNLRYPEKRLKKSASPPNRGVAKDVFLDGKPFDLRGFGKKAEQVLEELQELFSDLRAEGYKEIVRGEEGY